MTFTQNLARFSPRPTRAKGEMPAAAPSFAQKSVGESTEAGESALFSNGNTFGREPVKLQQSLPAPKRHCGVDTKPTKHKAKAEKLKRYAVGIILAPCTCGFSLMAFDR